MTRRNFLTTAAASGAAATFPTLILAAERPRRILLRSSWQTVNIGDVAHTPGILALLEKYLPQTEVVLWPSSVDNGVKEILLARFPKLSIAKSKEELAKAFEACDFLLHGSGPSLVGEKEVVRWQTATGKPYGVMGITLSPTAAEILDATVKVLSGAKFAYFRDGVSLALAQQHGCTCPTMGFGPDAAFATDLRDDAKADAFLKTHDLQAGKFLCCIPRLRYTPYWTIPSKNAVKDPRKVARNESLKEHDHAPLRKAIEAVLKATDLKVLICPEDQTQMAVGKEMLVDKLPASLSSRIVWKPDYWLTAEALSTYVRSAGLFGNEMHSPIMSIGNGIPAIVCRWSEQTSKGTMWKDIGLGDWLFDFDNEADVERMPSTVLEMATHPEAARQKAAKAWELVQQRHAAVFASI